MTIPRLSVSLGYWQDRPPEEALLTAEIADRLGYGELWIGEMATYDAFALATRVAGVTGEIALTLGPLPVSVRDPMTIARGAASVTGLTGRRISVAIGTSSDVVVADWHGRDRSRAGTALRESAVALRQLLDGHKTTLEGEVVRTRGYRLRLPAPQSELTVAAFGPSAVRTAALHADRMVLNLITPQSAAALVDRMRDEAERADRTVPRVAAWVTAAVDPSDAAIEQIRRAVVGYLAAPGYGEMFDEAGFGDLVRFARTRPHPRDLLAAIPQELVAAVGLVGDRATVRSRLAEYAAAGVDEVAVVAASVPDDPGGERTLTALRALA
ncbi:LLM class F420-dependent oxidoreductase [Planotetraspora phitsanulokensis]|uniref:LLM class F420-dependent oxidoreductase n=1 Tax=Planotetraspora phitsanulokensis TaxID=575192 RepID=A0A8J3U3F0_9ACTN|nr:LLM class F420-dependent oxidoreductase [Planotetraspora phitsanulokensis]GII36526.1 LLM class F420-dependent oxidoreductase [Planotetraspora phitsanulokensis]